MKILAMLNRRYANSEPLTRPQIARVLRQLTLLLDSMSQKEKLVATLRKECVRLRLRYNRHPTTIHRIPPMKAPDLYRTSNPNIPARLRRLSKAQPGTLRWIYSMRGLFLLLIDRRDRLDRQLEYWRDRLKSIPDPPVRKYGNSNVYIPTQDFSTPST